ncbi:hypothetical protein ABBQ32_013754 [Trebouxia sp. C0010 RCD-2024]
MGDVPSVRQTSSASGHGLPPTGSKASSANGQATETGIHSQSYQDKLAGRANSGVANALAAAAAGGADRDMQAAASGRLLPNDAELQYDVAVRLPGENQTQLEARMLTWACE